MENFGQAKCKIWPVMSVDRLLFRPLFDHVEHRVKVHYLDSKFFGPATHQDLFIQFMQALFKLDTSKMFQISMDGPIVNLKFLEKLRKII